MSWPHLIVLPIVLPLLAGGLLLLLERWRPELVWPVALTATLALAGIAAQLLSHAAGGAIEAYLLGNWRAPFGIVLALDRLSALMLTLAAVLALACLLYARRRFEREGAHFHALLQFQLMGLNGAFLTGDLFNLFVFFEVLLIASYGLLLHGGGAVRLRASLHYVTFNLTASALFLIAVSLLYGLTGTLNMADLAQRVAAAGPENAALIQAGALLLLVVFAVKAALLPLYFWLPDTYAAAPAPAAALFAVMTKVGIYAIVRVYTLVFGPEAGVAASVAQPWLPWLAIGTLLLASLGALGATRLRTLVAYLVVASAGTLLLALGLGSAATIAAGLFYLVPSTLAAAALFLLADRIGAGRGASADGFDGGAWSARREGLGVLFFLCAVSAAGVPPLAGFLGKAQLLSAAGGLPLAAIAWAAILLSSFAVVVALARAGSALFWKPGTGGGDAVQATPAQRGALALLVSGMVAAAVFAGPLAAYTQGAASQLTERSGYIRAVLDRQPAPPAWDVREGMVKP